MSLNVRHLTNGEKEIYAIKDFGILKIFNSLDEVPKQIRPHAKHEKLIMVGPDMARILGVLDVLYPNFPNCGMENYIGKKCVAESCMFAPDGDWTKCKYFKEEN